MIDFPIRTRERVKQDLVLYGEDLYINEDLYNVFHTLFGQYMCSNHFLIYILLMPSFVSRGK